MSQQWKFYESMSVSKDSTTTKKLICNIPETNQFLNDKDSPIVQGSFMTSSMETNPFGQLSNIRPFEDEQTSARKKQVLSNASNDQFPTTSIEKQTLQKLNVNENRVEDENFQFLMSLLPYLREVPKNRKLIVRHKLQKVFIDEQERSSFNFNLNHSAAAIQTSIIPLKPPPPYHRTNYSFTAPQVSANNRLTVDEQSNSTECSTSEKTQSQDYNNTYTNATDQVDQTSWTYIP